MKHQKVTQNLSKKLPIITHPTLSKVPEQYPPAMPILEQMSHQSIPSSQRLICSWEAAATLPIGHRGRGRRIHNVIVLA